MICRNFDFLSLLIFLVFNCCLTLMMQRYRIKSISQNKL
nr:MAG TPA: hypothetical protein [Caudoviricetes sp.]